MKILRRVVPVVTVLVLLLSCTLGVSALNFELNTLFTSSSCFLDGMAIYSSAQYYHIRYDLYMLYDHAVHKQLNTISNMAGLRYWYLDESEASQLLNNSSSYYVVFDVMIYENDLNKALIVQQDGLSLNLNLEGSLAEWYLTLSNLRDVYYYSAASSSYVRLEFSKYPSDRYALIDPIPVSCLDSPDGSHNRATHLRLVFSASAELYDYYGDPCDWSDCMDYLRDAIDLAGADEFEMEFEMYLPIYVADGSRSDVQGSIQDYVQAGNKKDELDDVVGDLDDLTPTLPDLDNGDFDLDLPQEGMSSITQIVQALFSGDGQLLGMLSVLVTVATLSFVIFGKKA